MDYQYTAYSMLALCLIVTGMVHWLSTRYCFRHRRDKVQVGPGKYVCPDCHQANITPA